MTRLNLLALVLAGLASLWLAGASHAREPAAAEALSIAVCVLGGDLIDDAAVSDAERPLLAKACSGHRNRLAIPCPTDRCLPPAAVTFAAFVPPQGLPLVRLDSDAVEIFVPDGHFRPPRRFL